MSRDRNSVIAGTVSLAVKSGIGYRAFVDEIRFEFIRQLLVIYRGNVTKVAIEIGVHRNTASRLVSEARRRGFDIPRIRRGKKAA